MDVFALARTLSGDTELTPEQRARLRALNTRYLTALHSLRRRDGPAPATGPPGPADAGLAELEASITVEIREMLAEARRTGRDRP